MAGASTVALSGAARVATMVYPASMNDDRVNNRIDEAVLALLYHGIFEHDPAMGRGRGRPSTGQRWVGCTTRA